MSRFPKVQFISAAIVLIMLTTSAARADKLGIGREATSKEIAVIKGHDDAVTSAAFSPDGKTIVTTSTDKTARIWPAQTGQALIDYAKQKLPRCLTEKQREEYALDENEPVWCDEMSKWPYKPRRWGVTTEDMGIVPVAGLFYPRVTHVTRGSPAEKAGILDPDHFTLKHIQSS